MLGKRSSYENIADLERDLGHKFTIDVLWELEELSNVPVLNAETIRVAISPT